MVDEIVIDSPLDMHAHLRQDEMLRLVAPLTSRSWAGVMAMPNLSPIVDSPAAAVAYRAAILEAAKEGSDEPFEAYTTLYFQTHYTRDFLADAKPHILSIKFYPRGMTTNSSHGCDPADPGVYDVLTSMEELGIPLSVHPEAEGYYHDREELFGKFVRDWVRRFPKLKVILEHLSDRHSVALLDLPNVHATITPQHLMTTGNDWFGPPFNPHLYCMPCVKRPEDRDALLQACFSDHPAKIMAGTDSAPHTEDRKVACGCAGVFSAPIAIQLYAQVFASAGKENMLQAFLSDNARRIYDITPPKRTVRLVREPFAIPSSYGNVIPMWAGGTLEWSIKA